MKKLLIFATLISLSGVVHAVSCIVSGSIERNCASVDYAIVDTIESRVNDEAVSILPNLESRFCSEDFSVISKFNSEEPIPFVIFIH